MGRLCSAVSALLLFAVFFQPGKPQTSGCSYTYGDKTGNRFVKGRGTFPAAVTFDLRHPAISAGGKHVAPIHWVLGRQGGNGTVHWFATDSNNKIWAFEHRRGQQPAYKYVMEGAMIPFLSDYAFDLPDDYSRVSHPVCLPKQNLLYISNDGDVVLIDKFGLQLARQHINALLDTRLVLNSEGTMVALYRAAAKAGGYVNGVLGDTIEGAAILILNTNDLSAVREIRLTNDHVIFEGISPMWVDLEGDGEEEIVATVSDNEVGATIFVFNTKGHVVARSDSVGQRSTWRHQLAVAKLGPHNATELVSVLDPHFGQAVEFFVKDGPKLRLVATRRGYTSHMVGSRNLDMGVVGDFDGNGQPELVLPNGSRNRITGLRHSMLDFEHGYVEEIWDFWLGKKLTSNIAAVNLWGDRLALGVGLEDGSLRIFLPNH